MSKRFFVILVAVIIGLGVIFWFTGKSDKVSAPTSSTAKPTNHITGEGKKGVLLVEYGDYQCPACGAYYPIVKQLVATYKTDITFQFRNFPLVQIHQNAFAAARAAEAAAKQNKFWQMHDLLYEQQQTWGQASGSYPYFQSFAQQLGLNLTQFKQDYESSEVNDLINADVKVGQSLGANSTPTFVLDGKKLEKNPQDRAAFSKIIDTAIKTKSQ